MLGLYQYHRSFFHLILPGGGSYGGQGGPAQGYGGGGGGGYGKSYIE